MKKVWEIYRDDMKNIATNWVVIVLIGGLVLLPSLYAWFNIKASWDPYGQTDQIPVGVVNEDEGATVRGENIDVGDELVKSLKDNVDMNWQFTDHDTAMDEVEYGNYYAVIVIPKDFSEDLATVVSGNPQKAEMNYYVNEKINAIAPKITDKGATVIVDEISSEFISTVNGVIFDMFNQIGLELEADLPDIEQFKEYIFTVEESLPEVHDLLSNTDGDATEAKKLIADVLGKIPEAESVAGEGLETIESTLTHVSNAESKLDELSPKIKEDLKQAQQIAHDIHDLLAKAEGNATIQEDIKAGMEKAQGDLDESITQLEQINTLLAKLEEQVSDEKEEGESGENLPDQETIAKAQVEVASLITVLETMGDDLDSLDGVGAEVDKVLKEVTATSKATSEKADQFMDEYTDTLEPAIRDALKSVKSQLTSAKGLVTDVQGVIPQVQNILESTDGNLDEGQGMIQDLLNEFPFVQDKVKETADKIRKIEKETDLEDIIDLLKNDSDAEQGFFAEPVKLHKNELFPIENYGTGMTPFYTVLAIWVGALLLISLLSTDLAGGNYTPKQMYAGRLGTFLTIGFLQTMIVTLGNMLLLGVNVSSPVWFVLFGICISVIFMLIVYTIVSIFGDVGKAIAIVLLVLQIAGSGGTYPVVLLPPFFQAINPFLPFTYAVDLLREAVGGIIWERVFHDLLFLGLFGVLFLLAGLFLKKPINRIMSKTLESKSSRLFH